MLSRHIERLVWLKGKAHKPGPTVMYDSVTVSEIPAKHQADAGYVGGSWPTYSTLVRDFPKAKHLSIAVSAPEDAECLDIETGDATPDEAPAWVRRQHITRPVVYSSVSGMAGTVGVLDGAGIHRAEVRVWTAHYTGTPHICGPGTCGQLPFDADATQWTSAALGRNLDASQLRPDFFP